MLDISIPRLPLLHTGARNAYLKLAISSAVGTRENFGIFGIHMHRERLWRWDGDIHNRVDGDFGLDRRVQIHLDLFCDLQ